MSFSINNTSSQTIIPPCLGGQVPTTAVPCVQNQGQVAHSVVYSWTSGGTLCTMLLDGSNATNGVGPWITLAAANSGTSNVTLNQSIGTGNGVLVTFSGTLTHMPLPNSVTVTAGAVTGTDNGAGSITGVGIASGSVNYTTGAISVTFSVAPANTVPVNVAYQNSITTGMIYSNGYYPYIRIKLSACSGGTLSAVYTGFSSPLPVTTIADAVFRSTSVASPVEVTAYGTGYPFVIKGFQVFNPQNAAVYIQFFKSHSAPTLGTNVFFEIGIPAGTGLTGTGGATFSYTGPDIPIINLAGGFGADNLWVGAATAPGGSTAASAVIVDVETNSTGPFYPMTPFSP